VKRNAPYPEFDHPRIYLKSFYTNLIARLGHDRFEHQCHRFLTVLTTDILLQQDLSKRFNNQPTIGWEQAQKTFLDVCLTKEQRLHVMKEMANLGRQPNETYKRYAARTLQYANLYNISDNSDIILEQLIHTIPTDTYNTLLKYQSKHPEETTFGSIKDFCETLGKLEGPNDSLDNNDQPSLSQSSSPPMSSQCGHYRSAYRGRYRGNYRGGYRDHNNWRRDSYPYQKHHYISQPETSYHLPSLTYSYPPYTNPQPYPPPFQQNTQPFSQHP
jgi:hypothetical protein